MIMVTCLSIRFFIESWNGGYAKLQSIKVIAVHCDARIIICTADTEIAHI